MLALTAIIGCHLAAVDLGGAVRGFSLPPQVPSPRGHRCASEAAAPPSSRAKKPCRRSSAVQRRASDEEEQEERGWPEGDEDWRDFRAKLVLREKEEQEETFGEKARTEGWAHETPLIEQGTLLLSTAGDHFALNQQYFHKAVILIVEHVEDGGDIGLILNRPTAFTTNDVKGILDVPEFSILNETMLLRAEEDPWNVWFGGDCQGLNGGPHPARIFCLHTREDLAPQSRRIIKGVFSIGYDLARGLVAAGEADSDDFLLLVGYCGWERNQMQDELDRGDTWTLAAADQRAVLGALSEAQAGLKQRLQAAVQDRDGEQSSVNLAAVDLGDGLPDWERLYLSLGSNFSQTLEEARKERDDEHSDGMLRRWIDRCLIPPRLKGTAALSAAAAAPESPLASEGGGGGGVSALKPFCILRGSSSAWSLGKPSEDESFGLASQFLPSQYLHRAVLMLYRYNPSEPHSILVMLNGPPFRKLQDGSNVYFGGMSMFVGQNDNIFQVGSESNPLRVQGLVAFPKGDLEKLVKLGALEVATDVSLLKVLDVPRQERWLVAGGKVESVSEAVESAVGDLQRRKWFRRFLQLELGAED